MAKTQHCWNITNYFTLKIKDDLNAYITDISDSKRAGWCAIKIFHGEILLFETTLYLDGTRTAVVPVPQNPIITPTLKPSSLRLKYVHNCGTSDDATCYSKTIDPLAEEAVTLFHVGFLYGTKYKDYMIMYNSCNDSIEAKFAAATVMIPAKATHRVDFRSEDQPIVTRERYSSVSWYALHNSDYIPINAEGRPTECGKSEVTDWILSDRLIKEGTLVFDESVNRDYFVMKCEKTGEMYFFSNSQIKLLIPHMILGKVSGRFGYSSQCIGKKILLSLKLLDQRSLDIEVCSEPGTP